MALLPHLVTPNLRNGLRYAQILRWAGRPTLRALHGRLRLVLLLVHHHPRPGRYLDGTDFYCYNILIIFRDL